MFFASPWNIPRNELRVSCVAHSILAIVDLLLPSHQNGLVLLERRNLNAGLPPNYFFG